MEGRHLVYGADNEFILLPEKAHSIHDLSLSGHGASEVRDGEGCASFDFSDGFGLHFVAVIRQKRTVITPGAPGPEGEERVVRSCQIGMHLFNHATETLE